MRSSAIGVALQVLASKMYGKRPDLNMVIVNFKTQRSVCGVHKPLVNW